jgi:hypothetical protein
MLSKPENSVENRKPNGLLVKRRGVSIFPLWYLAFGKHQSYLYFDRVPLFGGKSVPTLFSCMVLFGCTNRRFRQALDR